MRPVVAPRALFHATAHLKDATTIPKGGSCLVNGCPEFTSTNYDIVDVNSPHQFEALPIAPDFSLGDDTHLFSMAGSPMMTGGACAIDDFDILSSPVTSRHESAFDFEALHAPDFDFPFFGDLVGEAFSQPSEPARPSQERAFCLTARPPAPRKHPTVAFRPFASFHDLELTVEQLRAIVTKQISRVNSAPL
jgi:hypothetical protein